MSMQTVIKARHALAAKIAANTAYALAHPPTGAKVYIFPAGSGVTLYTWSDEMQKAAQAGVTMYLQPMATGGGADVIWPQPMGAGVLRQFPTWTADQVRAYIADKLKSANAGVLGATFDKVAPYIGAALLAYVSAGTLSQYAAATAATTSTAAAPAVVPASSVSSGFSAATTDLTATGGGMTAPASLIPSVAAPAADVSTASAINAGLNTALGISGGAVSDASLLTQFSAAATTLTDTVAAAAPAAVSTASSVLDTVTSLVPGLTPADAMKAYLAKKQIDQQNAAKAAAAAKAQQAQAQAAQVQANLNTIKQAQATQAAAPGLLTNITPGFILSMIAAGAALLS